MRRAPPFALLFAVAACSSSTTQSASDADSASTTATTDSVSTDAALADATTTIGTDSVASDAASPEADATTAADAGNENLEADATPADSLDAPTACLVGNVAGTCIDVSACDADAGLSPTPGYCPGPANIQCCALTPNVASNPPTPAGYEPMQNADVTAAMTAWAVAILNDPTDYPMFSTTTQTFGALTVLARVEWHPPDFQNESVHRGVTLYVPVSSDL